MEGIGVRVTVDPAGNVISAIADKSVSSDLQSRAEAAVKNVHFRPFERNGHTVSVSFADRVAVLPPELIPRIHVPFPTIRNWDSVRVKLRRIGCFGTCPSYRVEIHGDGSILYEGQSYVAVTGAHHGSISKETFAQLIDAFRNADYYSLKDEYVWPATDLSTYETSIEIDGKLKKIKDYAGEQVGMPLSVSKLEAEIDRLVDTERWTRGDENTVKSLTEEKWDFQISTGSGNSCENRAIGKTRSGERLACWRRSLRPGQQSGDNDADAGGVEGRRVHASGSTRSGSEQESKGSRRCPIGSGFGGQARSGPTVDRRWRKPEFLTAFRTSQPAEDCIRRHLGTALIAIHGLSIGSGDTLPAGPPMRPPPRLLTGLLPLNAWCETLQQCTSSPARRTRGRLLDQSSRREITFVCDLAHDGLSTERTLMLPRHLHGPVGRGRRHS
jgi:Domain of unknown function (DUF6438)/Gram-negative bacterial TonB protein C-terminal